jgi:hypothetical protein
MQGVAKLQQLSMRSVGGSMCVCVWVCACSEEAVYVGRTQASSRESIGEELDRMQRTREIRGEGARLSVATDMLSRDKEAWERAQKGEAEVSRARCRWDRVRVERRRCRRRRRGPGGRQAFLQRVMPSMHGCRPASDHVHTPTTPGHLQGWHLPPGPASQPALASRDASREPLSLFERTPPKDFLPPTWETPASATYTLLRPTRPPLSLLPSLYSSQEATANMIIYKVSALLACSLSLCAAQLPRLVPPSLSLPPSPLLWAPQTTLLCSALLLQPLQTPHHAQPLFANAPL